MYMREDFSGDAAEPVEQRAEAKGECIIAATTLLSGCGKMLAGVSAQSNSIRAMRI
jgi:hypothetical protein